VYKYINVLKELLPQYSGLRIRWHRTEAQAFVLLSDPDSGNSNSSKMSVLFLFYCRSVTATKYEMCATDLPDPIFSFFNPFHIPKNSLLITSYTAVFVSFLLNQYQKKKKVHISFILKLCIIKMYETSVWFTHFTAQDTTYYKHELLDFDENKTF
jgi:hypothetical protein